MSDINTDVDPNKGDGLHTPINSDSAEEGTQKHMGAKEGDPDEVRKTKPPTQSMAELTNKKGQAAPPDHEEFNPGDMITPG